MRRLFGLTLWMAGAALCCLAGEVSVPEIDAASGGAAVALLAGGLLVLRARRQK
jgi:hypothetical protein